MTASTPPLVDMISEAIYKARWVDNFGKEPVLATDEAIARAVLDALTKAGGVEWGTEYGPDDVEVSDSQQRAEEFSKNHGNRPTVSRITGPWTAVEDC